jgi:hypothetical protein
VYSGSAIQFIVGASQDLPAALALIEELEAQFERIKKALDPFERMYRMALPLEPFAEMGIRHYCPGAWPQWQDLEALIKEAGCPTK